MRKAAVLGPIQLATIVKGVSSKRWFLSTGSIMDVDYMLCVWRDRDSGLFEDTASLHALTRRGLRSLACRR